MIFKKNLSLLLTFFLLVSNLGLAFNVHYCDNQIASVTLSTASASQEAEMDCCGVVEKKSKCCKDKIIKSEIKSDQLVAKSLSFDVDAIPVYNDWQPIVFTTVFNFNTRENFSYYCDAHAPPLYLLYSQYTFYS
ncbi:HYC_CC_PP family protein [Flavobacterium sp.]|uniref:HYC_CC_PP family protein n=1 Tax=Flavobacterium sp. TaxID=239 RepID=UPI002FD8D5EB